MSILGPTGKPIMKKWEDQDVDEKLATLKTGIVLVMQKQEEHEKILMSISNSVESIVDAIEEASNNGGEIGRRAGGEEEVGVRTESGSSDANNDGAGEAGGGPEQKS